MKRSQIDRFSNLPFESENSVSPDESR
jgi:hypothetical protein